MSNLRPKPQWVADVQAKILAAGGKADGWDFIGEDGQIHHRDRNPIGYVPVYDLDYLSANELQDFLDRGRAMTRVEFARSLYPSRPLHYISAATTLWRMAVLRQRGRAKDLEQFNRLYRTLPPYAQFRLFFHVLSCVVPGKHFRKRSPKRVKPK